MSIQKSLFEIQHEYYETIQDLNDFFLDNPDHEGEVPDEYLERLSINQDEAEEKIDNYLDVALFIEKEVEALSDKIAFLKKKIQGKKRTSDKLKSLVIDAVALYGIPGKKNKENRSIETDEYRCTIVHTKPVVITDADLLPEKYIERTYSISNLTEEEIESLEIFLRDTIIKPKVLDISNDDTVVLPETKQTDKPVKRLIKKAIEELGHVPGARIDTQSNYLKIS
jgi:hypothetical protein